MESEQKGYAPHYWGVTIQCNLTFCMHYDEYSRRCSLWKYFYERKYTLDELDLKERERKRSETNETYRNSGAMSWDG